MRHRFKIGLLALGVVLGYGSAIGRAWAGHGWYDRAGHHRDGCHPLGEPGQPQSPAAPAAPKAEAPAT